MHSLTLRERSSKVYSDIVYSIPMSNDRSHLNLNSSKVEETKTIQQKRQIDKIMHGIIKQRLFGNFIEEQTRISDQNYMNLTGIHKKGFLGGRFKDRGSRIKDISKTIKVNSQRKERSSKRQVTFNTTIQCFSSAKQAYSIEKYPKQKQFKRFFKSESRKRKESIKFPDLEREDTSRSIKKKPSISIAHAKKLEFNEKSFHDTFRKWSGAINSQILIYELKISRQQIIGRLKSIIDGSIIQKFFYFFGFPQQFGLRQYANLIENAANATLRFIYFWVFIIFDEESNGILTSQDLFKFLKRFPQSSYLEQEIFLLERHISILQRANKANQRSDIEIPIEQSLTVNRNLRMQQLKDILKQTSKERIEVNCVKNTCYHQTILSLEHDTLQRAKLNQIQNNQEVTKLMKLKKKDEKKRLQNLPGLRLRDFSHIFCGRRPKIFCYVLHLLAGVRPHDYE